MVGDERKGEKPEQQVHEQVRFLEERAAVAKIQAMIAREHDDFPGATVLDWAQETGVLSSGGIVMAEISPSLRCSETCPGCPDSSLLLLAAIEKGLVPKIEVRADIETMQRHIDRLYDLGVRHFMFIGGTIDALPETPHLINYAQALDQNVRVSWFSDGIMQINEAGDPTNLFQKNQESGWIHGVATHVSMDYPFVGSVLHRHQQLPSKKGRLSQFTESPEYSRQYKSQYGAMYARRLIEAGTRRVVINTTVSPHNQDDIWEIYQQVAVLQKYAQAIGSPTEVLWTFSPWIWRPHQARGDGPEQSPATAGLQMKDMEVVNAMFDAILTDTRHRILDRVPRLLANSAGYTELMAEPQYRQLVVDQAVPYEGGRPEILQVNPTGDIQLDPMFGGPELAAPVNSIFGYRDREPRAEHNPFTPYHTWQRGGWFPNIITT